MSQSPIKSIHRRSGSLGEFLTPTVIENDVQVLNSCFDDIERFVTRIQAASEHLKELERRKKARPGEKKLSGDGVLNMRAQLPPTKDYFDIFQKFKLSFNLLAKLKAYIHDPNAPELIHFLFTPLSLIVSTTKEQPYRGLTKTVWLPLLTRDSKLLLLNCLTSKEVDLWQSLGDAWVLSVEEAHDQPEAYGHLKNQVYIPTFSNGWTPSLDPHDPNDLSRFAFAAAMQVDAKSNNTNYNHQYPIEKNRSYANTHPQFDNQMVNKVTPTSTNQIVSQQMPQKYGYSNGRPLIDHKQSSSISAKAPLSSTVTERHNHSLENQQQVPKYSNNRQSEQMRNWAIDLCMRGGK